MVTPHEMHNFWLFLSILLLLIASPFAEDEPAGLRLLFSLIIVAAVYATRRSRFELIVASCLAAIWLVLSWTGVAAASRAGTIATDAIFISLLALTLVLILIDIFSAGQVTANRLFGAVAVYFLLAVAWAVGFSLLETLMPGSFATPLPHSELTSNDFLYFSLTTLTTLGYGDVTPVTASARIWANLEAAMGVLYVAILVARLVSLYRD